MKLLSAIVIAGLLALAGFTTAHAASSGPATKPVSAVIKGIGVSAPSSDVDPTTGACNVSSWVDVCPSGKCSCAEVSPVTIHASGKGAATVLGFFVTIDKDVNPATEPAPTGSNGPNPTCNPLRGVVAVQAGGSSTFAINLLGVSCKHVIGISARNPQGKHDKDLISGGWGISADPTPSPDMSGWGTMTGSIIQTTSALTLNLAGWTTK